jgi:hypothetical protein
VARSVSAVTQRRIKLGIADSIDHPAEEQRMSGDEHPCPIGCVPFADGVERDVFEDSDGRQWVTGYDAERVYGVWLMPADEPVVLERGSS